MKLHLKEIVIVSTALSIVLFLIEKQSPGFVLLHMRIAHVALIALLALIAYLLVYE